MKLSNIDMVKLLPPFMREESDNIALAGEMSAILQEMQPQLAKLATWGHLTSLNTDELDELIDELNIFWADKSLTDDQKRAIISNSDKVYMKLGTKKAVEDVVNEIFGPSGIEEFFEFGGLPHHFRIRIDQPENLTSENEARLRRVLDKVKRKSQWLDAIRHELLVSIPLNIGMSVATHDVTRICFDQWLDSLSGDLLSGADVFADQTGSESEILTIN